MADGTVAVLGTGIMGAAMARNLSKAGLEVRAWNRSRKKAEPLADEGIRVADTPEEAARDAEFLLTMLADADAVAEVVEGGVLESLAESGGVWIQASTVGIEGNERLEALAAEAVVPYVDAPVLGTKAPAEQGQLTILASGPDELHEKCAPVFDAIGSETVWLGEAGAGSRMKLVVNGWIVGLLGVLAETVALAGATGVDPKRFLDVIEGGPLGLPYARIKGNMMIEDDFPTSFSLKLARKDAGLVLEAAREAGLDLAITEAVAARFDQALEAGHGEEDMAAVYRTVGRRDRSAAD